MERVSVTVNRREPSCEALRQYFAEVFSSLDERPRQILVTLDVRNDAGVKFAIDFLRGELSFCAGAASLQVPLRKRYIPEHPVPLDLPVSGVAKFVMTPASGNRVRVRRANFFERIFG